MLQTPPQIFRSLDPRMEMVLNAIAEGRGENPGSVLLEDGVVQLTHFSLDMLIWNRNAPEHYMGYPWLGDDLNSYGVCDSPKQFLQKFGKRLRDDVRVFCMSFTHIEKDPGHAGQGGGWRWHKWGPYVGEGTPSREYLDDEDGFDDGVWVYQIHQFDGPEVKAPWEKA